MKKIFYTFYFCLLTACTANADLIPLTLPGIGNHASGSTFTTSNVMHSSGASFDLIYTLNALATTNTPAASIQSDGTAFGVASAADGDTLGQLLSIDGNDGEQVTITGLNIVPASFNAGTSGLSLSNFALTFKDLEIADGTAGADGANVFVDGSTTAQVFTSPVATVALAPGGSTLVVEPNSSNFRNRFTISGITAHATATAVVVPEPTSTSLLALGVIGLAARRRR